MALEFDRERTANKIRIETRPVEFSDYGEEEYDWIVRSTPAASDLFTLVDDWSTPEALTLQKVDSADLSAYQYEESAEPAASTTQERFLAEWCRPELVQPATEFFDNTANENDELEMSTAPTVADEVDLVEWSGPELVQPAIDLFEADELEVSTASAAEEEVDLAEWCGPELVQPATELNEVDELEISTAPAPGTVPGAVATGSKTQNEVDVAEWSGPELALPPPTNFFESELHENDELEVSTAPAPGTVPGAVATGLKTQSEVDIAEWSEPELVQPASELFDAQASDDDELEVSTAPAPGTVPGAVATGSKIQNEVDSAESREPNVEPESSAVPSLKYPPPIWDQVPVYAAAEFHPTGALLTRLSAINWTLVLATVMVMSICGVCAFAILKLVQLDQNKASAAPAQQLAKQPEPRVEVPARSVGEKPAEPATPGSETAAAATAPNGQPESKPAPDTIATSQPVTASDSKLAKPGSQSGAPKNSTTSNAVAKAPSRTVLANRRNTTPPTNPRQIARSISTSHSSVSTPTSSPTPRRSSPSSVGSSPTSRGSSPSSGATSSGRRPEPAANKGSQSAPTVNEGDGSTRPRRVNPRP